MTKTERLTDLERRVTALEAVGTLSGNGSSTTKDQRYIWIDETQHWLPAVSKEKLALEVDRLRSEKKSLEADVDELAKRISRAASAMDKVDLALEGLLDSAAV